MGTFPRIFNNPAAMNAAVTAQMICLNKDLSSLRSIIRNRERGMPVNSAGEKQNPQVIPAG